MVQYLFTCNAIFLAKVYHFLMLWYYFYSLAGVWESLGHLLLTLWALKLGGGCRIEKHGKGTHASLMIVRSKLMTEIFVQLKLDISKIDYLKNIYGIYQSNLEEHVWTTVSLCIVTFVS